MAVETWRDGHRNFSNALFYLAPAVASARQQDRDGDNVPGGTEPSAAPSGAPPGVQ